jgi:ATP-dependent Clp protease ATP-binding subunit ClpC
LEIAASSLFIGKALGHRGREETTGGSDVAMEPARRVVAIAQEEAQALGSHYVGTEHLLLGLLREERGRAAGMLRRFGLTTERVRTQITRTVGQSEGAPAAQPRLTPAARRTFERAAGALSLRGDERVDTEHVLLGLVQDGEGVAARVMGELDVDPGDVRRQAILALAPARS